ncbi:hypothetical protein CEXT_138801 [Caerostris extrusa]|uniref:Uncharacterized protein n=1 Tax=Caerostris extrusa TaxID=172846 RepID=A0AAV4R9S1_CAEEX|nr:hypothetical protein CEXT_138801 [Caerostris extrusa]
MKVGEGKIEGLIFSLGIFPRFEVSAPFLWSVTVTETRSLVLNNVPKRRFYFSLDTCGRNGGDISCCHKTFDNHIHHFCETVVGFIQYIFIENE